MECPKCNFEFDDEKYMKDKIDGPASFIQNIERKIKEPLFKAKNGLDKISESTLTVCPNCQNVSPFYEYKYFGFLGIKSFRLVLILFILGFILFVFTDLLQNFI